MSTLAETTQIAGPAAFELGPPGGMAEVGTGGAGGTGDAWRIIKQRKLLIIVTFIVLYLLVVAVTLLVLKFAPAYPSEAILELKAPPSEAISVVEAPLHPDIMGALLETEARKLSSLGLLADVLKQPAIKETRFYKWYDNDIAECLYDLQEMISSTPIPNTQLIRVSLACADADEARLIVQTTINRFMNKFKDESTDESRITLEALKVTRAGLARQLADKQKAMADFQAIADVPALETGSGAIQHEVATLTTSLAQLQTESAYYESQLDFVQGVDPRKLPITPEIQVFIEADPILRFYRSQVENLDIEMQVLTTKRLGKNHRQIEELQVRRQGYLEREVARREELIDTLRDRQLEQLRQTTAAFRLMQVKLGEQLEDANARQRDLDRNLSEFLALAKDELRLQQELTQIEMKVQEAEHMAQSQQSQQRLSLVQSPQRAIRPSRPDYFLFLGGGFVLAAIGSLGLAFLREFTDKAVRTPVDVARFGRFSVLGTIPLLDDEEADVDEIEDATRKAPHSLVAESFRQVRANLLFSGPPESQRVLMLTSAGPGDGKTSAAINLAVTFAHSNQRVLLIDCNFRRPAIRAAFPDTRPEGLSNVLIGQATLDEVVTHTDLPNLDVVSSGPMPPRPSELLGSKYMTDLIEQAKQKYDRVIFDGPPALLISDALVIATQVDGVILVARAVHNTKGALKRAREQLDRINARVLGAILNGVQARPGGYFREQYREFYDYVSDETIPQELPGMPSASPLPNDSDNA